MPRTGLQPKTRERIEQFQARGPGNPTKLNKSRHKRIVDGVAACGRLSVSARAAGIAQSTAWGWVNRGAAYQKHLDGGGAPDERERKFLEFAVDIAKAEATFELACMGTIRAQGQKHTLKRTQVTDRMDADGNHIVTTVVTETEVEDYQALVFALQQQERGRYSRDDIVRMEHTGPDGGPIENVTLVGVADLSEEADVDERTARRILAALAESRSGSRELGEAHTNGSGVGAETIDAASYEVHAPSSNGSSNGVSPS